MRNVLEAVVAAQESGRHVAYTALVETRGSTPQKAGAAMLVYEDGSQVGTLGGGCVEAEVKRKALENLVSGATEIVDFQLDHDYGWDDGLICGGRMRMLIAPLRNATDFHYYERYLQQIVAGEGAIEAIVMESSANVTTGDRFLFDQHADLIVSSSESTISSAILEHLPVLADRPRPSVRGGIAYLPQLPEAHLVIVGAGHVGRKLAEYAADVDFRVTVVDDREIYCNRENIPHADEWIVGDFDQVLPELEIDSQSFCVIVTRGHNHDEEALFHLIQRQPRYLGMIGSKRKIRLIFDDLKQNGIDPSLLEQVHSPLGLEIGSQTVPEIAVSIVAQLILYRNCPETKHTPVVDPTQACD